MTPQCPHCNDTGTRRLVTLDGRIVTVDCGAGEHQQDED